MDCLFWNFRRNKKSTTKQNKTCTAHVGGFVSVLHRQQTVKQNNATNYKRNKNRQMEMEMGMKMKMKRKMEYIICSPQLFCVLLHRGKSGIKPNTHTHINKQINKICETNPREETKNETRRKRNEPQNKYKKLVPFVIAIVSFVYLSQSLVMLLFLLLYVI